MEAIRALGDAVSTNLDVQLHDRASTGPLVARMACFLLKRLRLGD
jgi:hypothetical protein